MADKNIRPEVRKILAALEKVGPCTMPEVREMMRAVLTALSQSDRWHASFLTGEGDSHRVAFDLRGKTAV